ncbi:MAG: glycosyltransferase, partial [Nitrososphaera sp.]
FLLPKVDGVVANSFALAHDLVAGRFLPSKRVIGAHMGINLKLYDELRISKPDARRKLGLPLDKKIALYSGKIYLGYKEIDYLLEAAQLLPSDVEVVFVGGRADHVQCFRELLLKKNISNATFVGFVPPNLVQYYQLAADVLLLYYPSGMDLNKYRSPGKLFEYMASGRPIVAADYPVLREVLGDDPAAVLVPPDSPQRLAQNIKNLLADSSKMESLATRALERVSQFTWEARARRILDFIVTIAE